MSWFNFRKVPPAPEVKDQQFETVLQRLVAAASGGDLYVNPDNCMRAPTVHAVVTAISRRIQTTPVHVFKKTSSKGRDAKEYLPSHPVAKLLKAPNDWQTSVDYFGDMASTLARWGRFIAVKGQGTTGPIRKLFPLSPGVVNIKQDHNDLSVKFHYGTDKIYPMSKVNYIRGPAVDFLTGDSPVENVRTAIGIEIACELYGQAFFENGGVPLLIFKYIAGAKGFKTAEDEQKFINDFQTAFTGNKRHKALLLPPGLEADATKIENNRAQFLETRKFYQTVIAGAWGVPPHLVGNLENGHYNNVEQQDKDFTLNVIMPYIIQIESAMERDLLTQDDRNAGIVIRFNMDSVLRASFEERQKGLQTQFQNGIINSNEWREIEGKNPRDKGDDYYYSANLIKEGAEPPTRQTAGDSDAQADDDESGDQIAE